MNRKEDGKAAKERAIFDAFLKCDGAPKVELDTVESRRPPEPDILCKITGHGFTAFELVEIIEGEWAQLVGNQIRLEKSLYLKHEQLAQPLQTAYGDALIYIRCRPLVGIRQRENAIPALFEFLQGLPNRYQGDAKPEGDLFETFRSVGISRGDFGPGPFFQVEAVSSIGDPTPHTIQGKWLKTYETAHPIELLAYYGLHPTIPDELWLVPVQSFVDANWTTSPFRKVWI